MIRKPPTSFKDKHKFGVDVTDNKASCHKNHPVSFGDQHKFGVDMMKDKKRHVTRIPRHRLKINIGLELM